MKIWLIKLVKRERLENKKLRRECTRKTQNTTKRSQKGLFLMNSRQLEARGHIKKSRVEILLLKLKKSRLENLIRRDKSSMMICLQFSTRENQSALGKSKSLLLTYLWIKLRTRLDTSWKGSKTQMKSYFGSTHRW